MQARIIMKSIRPLCEMLLIAVLVSRAKAQDAALARQQIPPQGTFAFVDVNVIPMDRDTILPNRTVVVTGGKIVALGTNAGTTIPAGAQRIDGRGKYLMPG